MKTCCTRHLFLVSAISAGAVSIQQESVDTSMVSKSTPRPSVTSGILGIFRRPLLLMNHPFIKNSSHQKKFFTKPEVRKEPWLVGLYRGLYYPVI